MPTFVLRCSNEKCGKIIETAPNCKHSSAIETICDLCGSSMIIQPQAVRGVVHGFSAENGYHRETLSYDGNHPG